MSNEPTDGGVTDALIEKAWRAFVNADDDRYFGNRTKMDKQKAALRQLVDDALAMDKARSPADEGVQTRLLRFLEHGDAEHKAWLGDAISAFFDGRPRPEPRPAPSIDVPAKHDPAAKPCRYCGGVGRFQIVSSVSDHAWTTCFCAKHYPAADEGVVDLIERLNEEIEFQGDCYRTGAKYPGCPGLLEEAAAALATIQAVETDREVG